MYPSNFCVVELDWVWGKIKVPPRISSQSVFFVMLLFHKPPGALVTIAKSHSVICAEFKNPNGESNGGESFEPAMEMLAEGPGRGRRDCSECNS